MDAFNCDTRDQNTTDQNTTDQNTTDQNTTDRDPAELFSSELGEVTLRRYPRRPDEQLRAFDGADRLIVDEVASAHGHADHIWVIGDRQGALTTALATSHPPSSHPPSSHPPSSHAPSSHPTSSQRSHYRQVISVTDSATAMIAIEQNLARNHATATVTSNPHELALSTPDLIVIRPGTSKSQLLHQLHHLAADVPAGTPLVLGEMAKHLRPWMTDALRDQFGPTTASLGRFKARLLRSTRDHTSGSPPPFTSYPISLPSRQNPSQEIPSRQNPSQENPSHQLMVHNSPGTFASSGLDRGTRLMLHHLPTGLGGAEVIDLGCGNGVLAIALALLNPDCQLTLVDESAAAIVSARRSWQQNLADREAQFVHADGLATRPPASADVVLCNPPFHAGIVVDEWFGRRLLDQAATCLRPDGELWVVANRHLAHHRHLSRRFARVEVVAADAKFSVLRAVVPTV